MKINKTLAAGIAATIAVTSLASVASAVKQRTWPMEKTYGHVKYSVASLVAKDEERIFDLGKDYLYKADPEGKAQAETFAIALGEEEDEEGNTVMATDTADHHNGTVAYDYFMTFKAVADHPDLLEAIGGVELVITGKQLASDGATTEKLVQRATLKNIKTADDKVSDLWILPIYTDAAPRGAGNVYQFMPERFVQVDSVSIEVTGGVDKEFWALSESAYKAIVNNANSRDNTSLYVNAGGSLSPIKVTDEGKYLVPIWWINTLWGGRPADEPEFPLSAIVRLLPTGKLFSVADYFRSDWKAPIDSTGAILENQEVWVEKQFDDFDEESTDTNDAEDAEVTGAEGYTLYNDPDNITRSNKNGNGEGETVKLAKAAFEVDLSIDAKGQKLIKKLIELCKYNDGAALGFVYRNSLAETYDELAWLPRTEWWDSKGKFVYEDHGKKIGDEIITRDEVWKLSDTEDYKSTVRFNVGSGSEDDESAVQTYEVEDYNKGTKPHGFAGMASQFADFFNNPGNARKEAKVIFTFEAYTPADNGSDWKNGGIPSTEVGLKNFLEKQDVKDFALFVNYKATTGSLFATATLDAESGSVIFDVSDILKALNGTTIGSVQDLYYALASGIIYKDDAANPVVGLYVKEVTYEYNDAASDTAADTDADKKDEEKPADNKPADNGDKEITIGGDDKETEIPADNSGNAGNNGSAVVDNGANKADENPHTGVALAVIPAIVAGAAVVVSKKRK